MKTLKTIFILSAMALSFQTSKAQSTLKKAFQNDFYFGTALNLDYIYGRDKKGVDLVKKEFNAIVAENCMKSMFLQPEEGHFFFKDADRFVAFGEKNKMFITGHTLIWHSQAPDWFFVDDEGKDVSAEVLKQRMKTHIQTVVSRYKGRIKGWDVVNEAILDDGSYRKSKFYEIVGEDFIPLAFQWAREADPNAELYYNDYNAWMPEKVKTIVKLISDLKAKGIRIDGVGMQGHIGMDYPDFNIYEQAIEAYAAAGVKVSISELDMSALPSPNHITSNISDTENYQKDLNPYVNGLPAEVQTQWDQRYLDFFRLLLKHRNQIERVTVWGVTDSQSWKNDFPIVGRTDYPLLFDRKYQPKPIVKKLIQLAKENKN